MNESAIYRTFEIRLIGMFIFVVFHGVPYRADDLDDAKKKIDDYWKDKAN